MIDKIKPEVIGYKHIFKEEDNLPMSCYGIMGLTYMKLVVQTNFNAGYKIKLRPVYEYELKCVDINQFICSGKEEKNYEIY